MTLYRKNGGAPQELPGEDRLEDGTILTDLANDAESRAALGWVAAPEKPSPTAGHEVLWDVGTEAWIQVALPPPPDAELPKSVVTNRLIQIAKIDAVYDVLAANKAMFALWFAPDWQHVVVTDPRVHGLLQGAGLTQVQIDEVLNPDPTYVPPAA